MLLFTGYVPTHQQVPGIISINVINNIALCSAVFFLVISDPEGLEGWRPEDFQRPRPGMGRGLGPRPPLNPDIDPDIGPPPPGRGADWDNMFG
jgi:hypothetical protein